MSELVDELAARAGIDDAIAEKTIGIMLDYLRSEGPPGTRTGADRQHPRCRSRDRGGTRRRRPLAAEGGGLMAVGTRLMVSGSP